MELLAVGTGLTYEKMGLMWSLAHILFFDEPPRAEDLVSVRQMRRQMYGLGEAEQEQENLRGFEDQLKRDKNFPTMWYMQSDDFQMANCRYE